MNRTEKFIDFMRRFRCQGEQFFVRSISEKDIETLRRWKNNHRKSFFYQGIISPKQQKAWYSKFVLDDNQQMFVCETVERLIACVGFKNAHKGKIELYNLICGDPRYLRKGLMSHLYQAIEKIIKEEKFNEIYLYVLKNNVAAQEWYKRQGFKCQPRRGGNSYLMKRFIEKEPL